MANNYKHRFETVESEDVRRVQAQALSGLQVIVGTAPINKVADASAVVNVPIMVQDADEAKSMLGYSEDYENYTLCPSMDLMETFGIGPVIFINVLDPATHKKENTEKEIQVNSLKATYEVDDVILSTMVVKNDTATLTLNSDYIVDYEGRYPIITLLSSGTASEATALKVTSNSIDPSRVTKTDIIGSYNVETGETTGIECVRDVFPDFSVVPGMILAPGWSEDEDVAAALQLKTEDLYSAFDLFALLDVDTSIAKAYSAVKEQKDAMGADEARSVTLWPACVYNGKIVPYSAVWGAMAAYTDAQHDDIPYKSPSNEYINITGTCRADGSKVKVDLEQAEYLNGDGVVTAINFNGYRSWGNNTSAYPEIETMKDRWIACRRMMNWYKNNLILRYLDRIDQPNDPRQIENLVDAENLYLNGIAGSGIIAGGSISYDPEDNPEEDVLNGWQTFEVQIAFWAPNEYIKVKIRFNPELIRAAYTATNE